MSLFHLKDISVTYGAESTAVHALNKVSLEIKEGETIAVVGASGSGKSTLLNVLSGLENATEGEISFDEKKYKDLSRTKLAKLRLENFGFVFQSFYLISSLTVRDNILLPAVTSHGKPDMELFEKLVGHLGLVERLDHLPNQLSGGEKQRVAIARALINKPKVIFADEPSGNLDSENGVAVFELLFQLAKEYGQTLIYVTHDLEKAELAERQIKIKDGRVSV